jgi:hypothetical protein
MKEEWPTISLLDEDHDVEAGEDPEKLLGTEQGNGRDLMPGAPARPIDNEDPNAAENQPEPGQEVRSNPPLGVTKGS